MLKNHWFVLGASTFIFLAGLSAGSLLQSGVAHAQAAKHVFEVRTYTAPEGKLGELHARFRDHTVRIFNKHGMKSVIYMTPRAEAIITRLMKTSSTLPMYLPSRNSNRRTGFAKIV